MPYLFSFGSNNKDQLEDRLKVKINQIYPAYYPNHQLAFGSWSKKWGGSVGTIIKSKGNSVLGYIVNLDNKDFDRLDKFEAVHLGKYKRHKIRIKLKETDQIKVAICYLLTKSHQEQWLGVPSDSYIKAIKKTIKHYHGKDIKSIPIVRSDNGIIV